LHVLEAIQLELLEDEKKEWVLQKWVELILNSLGKMESGLKY